MLYLPGLAPVTLGRLPVLSPCSKEGVSSSCLSCRAENRRVPCLGHGALADRALLARVSAVVWEGATVALTVAPCTGVQDEGIGGLVGRGQSAPVGEAEPSGLQGGGRARPPVCRGGHRAQSLSPSPPPWSVDPCVALAVCGSVGWDGCVPWGSWVASTTAGGGRVWCWDSCVHLVLGGGCGRGGSENGAQGPCRVPCLPVLRCGPGDR